MAILHGTKIKTLASGSFESIVSYFPALSHTVHSVYYRPTDKISYEGTTYRLDLAQTNTGVLAVLQITEHYSEEIGVGDGACDYDCSESYHLTCPVDPSRSLEDEGLAMSLFQNGNWSEVRSDSVSYRMEFSDYASDPNTLTMPEGMTEFSASIGGAEQVKHLILPASFTQMRNWNHFYEELTDITVEEGNPYFSSQDGILYSKDKTTLLCCPVQREQVVVPEGVKVIAEDAFYYCTAAVIELPQTLEAIGRCAFSSCKNLTCLKLPDRVQSIGDFAFSFSKQLQSLTLPKGLTVLPQGACNGCTALTALSPLASIHTVGERALYECTSLQSVTFASSVTVGPMAFFDCSALTEVRFEGDAAFGEGAFTGCSSLQSVEILGCLSACEKEVFQRCKKLRTFHLKDAKNSACKVIGYRAFRNCTSLQSITLPQNITEIGSEAFSNCSALTEINLPNSLRYLGWELFAGCSALEEILLPNGITTMFRDTFSQCSSLRCARLPKHLEEICDGMFEHCTALETVYFPEQGCYVEESAFTGCTSLTRIYVPQGWTKRHRLPLPEHTRERKETPPKYPSLREIYYGGNAADADYFADLFEGEGPKDTFFFLGERYYLADGVTLHPQWKEA